VAYVYVKNLRNPRRYRAAMDIFDRLAQEVLRSRDCTGRVCGCERINYHAKAFRRAVSTIVRNGGVAWIPAFALDRTQRVLWELRQAQREGIRHRPLHCVVARGGWHTVPASTAALPI
jgi:predicted metal-dependent RNase